GLRRSQPVRGLRLPRCPGRPRLPALRPGRECARSCDDALPVAGFVAAQLPRGGAAGPLRRSGQEPAPQRASGRGPSAPPGALDLSTGGRGAALPRLDLRTMRRALLIAFGLLSSGRAAHGEPITGEAHASLRLFSEPAPSQSLVVVTPTVNGRVDVKRWLSI